jgi:hypothetical protein
MEHKTLVSSHLVSAGYDAESQALEVRFRNGITYRYVGVPIAVYENLMHAASPGAYHAAAIKGCYPWSIQHKETEHGNS